MKDHRGFTLIELIIYIALVSIFLTGAVFFAWDVVYGREKSFIQQTVQQEDRRAILRLGFEIRRAETINSITPTQLSLEMAEEGINPTLFSLSDGTLQMTQGAFGPYDLTSNQVYVSSLEFVDLSSTNSNSKNIQVALSLRQAQTGVSAQFEAQTTLIDSFELNSAFNEARKLLIDTTAAELTQGNKKIEGITIQNSATDDIVINKMTVSWTDEDDEKIETIVINGSDVWAGSENSGTLLDIDNFTVTGDETVFDIDYLEFDKSMTESTVTIVFTMSDGSTLQAEMSFGAGVAPSPSPNPTPSASPSPATCAEYCQSLEDYSSGTCRQNKTQCDRHDETHESDGDQYCAEPSENTCCCAD